MIIEHQTKIELIFYDRGLIMERQDLYLYTGLFGGILAGFIIGTKLNNDLIITIGVLISVGCFVMLGIKSIMQMKK